jgi:ubiquinone/menaquinone biosynthesis C-methylase UbiE
VALDIAQGMLDHARPLGGAQYFIAGDAERLPLQAASCGLIFSSLAVQWCADFAAVLSEAYRVLQPGGRAGVRQLVRGHIGRVARKLAGGGRAGPRQPLPQLRSLSTAVRGQ